MHQPGIGPGSKDWKSLILPLNYWCCVVQAGLEPAALAYLSALNIVGTISTTLYQLSYWTDARLRRARSSSKGVIDTRTSGPARSSSEDSSVTSLNFWTDARHRRAGSSRGLEKAAMTRVGGVPSSSFEQHFINVVCTQKNLSSSAANYSWTLRNR